MVVTHYTGALRTLFYPFISTFAESVSLVYTVCKHLIVKFYCIHSNLSLPFK